MEAIDSEPIINIIGEIVALGPLRRDLLPLYLRWLNDFDVIATLGAPLRPKTLEQETAWYDTDAQSEKQSVFTVYERATMNPIGSTGLHHISHTHRTAEFGLMIGDKTCWNKGCGTECARLMLRYGFQSLGLHNIHLRVFSHNPGGLRAYSKAGFRECGRLREAFRVGPNAYDDIWMECLSNEWDAP